MPSMNRVEIWNQIVSQLGCTKLCSSLGPSDMFVVIRLLPIMCELVPPSFGISCLIPIVGSCRFCRR